MYQESEYLLRQAAAEVLRPEPEQAVWEWAESNLYLLRGTETPGRYSTMLYPYVREVLECFRDRSVSDVVLAWGAQTAKTQTLLTGLAWTVRSRAVDALWAMDSETNARSVSKHRWQPLVDDSPALRAIKPMDGDRYTNLEQQFGDIIVRWIGSNSPGRAASTPVGLVIQDEIDKYREGTQREASSVRLIDERTKGFAGGKRVKSSTPTTESAAIWREWLNTDQRRYYVPCPHCGVMDYLQWPNVTWDQEACDESGRWDFRRVKASAHYRCPHCSGRITDAHKSRMLRQGEWRPTNAYAPPGVRGYHVSTLYSPQRSFADCAIKFLLDKDDPDGLRNFINSWLAEPWTERATLAEPSQIDRAKGDYDRGAKLGALRVMTVDVQRADMRYLIRGYDGPLSRMLDYGAVATWEELDAMQAEYGVDHVGVDTSFGERSQECYEAIYTRAAKGWIAIRGRDKMQTPFAVRWFAPFTGQRVAGMGRIRMMFVNQGLWRGELARRRIGQVDTWRVPRELPAQYVREIFCEYQSEKIINGRVVTMWKTKHKDNHAFDCEIYQLAMAQWLGVGSVVSWRGVRDMKKMQQEKQSDDDDNEDDKAPEPLAQ